MNILQILPELNVGGVETGTVDLARNLVKLGHKAVVVSNGGKLVEALEQSGAIHYQLPVHKKSIFTIVKMVGPLSEIIRKEKIDIVHARSRMPAWVAYFASRRTRTVFITTCHGYYSKHLFSRIMGWAKRVIVLSNIIARHMIDDFGVPYERIRLVARSVDVERFQFTSPEKKRKAQFNIGVIARLTPIKGHLHFIKAMAKVARVMPDLKIWIVGDAPASKWTYKEQMQVLVKRLGLWNSTEFLGVQRNIPEILSHLDCLVLPTTTHEAFGRVIIEAQASGVPVVATRVGGVIDVIDDGITGLLVPPADPQAIADAVIKIHNDAKLAARLAENAYRKVKEKYNLELMVKNTLHVYEEALKSFKILVIKLSSLGDVILSAAALRALREKFPLAKITLLTAEECKDTVLRCPYIDELLVCDFKNRDSGVLGFLKFNRILQRNGFDMVIDLQNNRKSHLASFLSGALDRYGYDNGKLSFLLNHRIKNLDKFLAPVEHQFKILKMLGIELKESRLELWPSAQDDRYIDELLSSHWLSTNQKLVGINISASSRWQTKNWPVKQIAKLCEGLAHRDLRVIITGMEKDLKSTETLVSLGKDIKFINACGKTTINQLASLIKRCAVYISVDSAALHIASAMQIPFVALFGPTDYRRHLPPAQRYQVIQKALPCAPCYKGECKDYKCMEMITAQEVLEAVERLLSNDK